ncbi:DinB family protein [Janibacter alkaliphilus]|uniref:DinB family protein n=1 Tax=Janibacter alkaliphilus TaxID=1069963 RepID=A0A852X096_9MICO|nr:DinB family protein [Janibacter alkaliphilus]NYG36279.1 hypothetical protein [Janibacter alkaliphilus]
MATPEDPKATLHRYLRQSREALLWKLDGLSERDQRRPLTPTGTNLLGLIKHEAFCEQGYLGDTFGRPGPLPDLWADLTHAEDNADMFAAEDESAADVVAMARAAWAHADATVDALDLDATGRVPGWPAERAEITLHQALVHLLVDVARHAGHADILREQLDGSAGLRPDMDNLPEQDQVWWAEHVARLQRIADARG